MKDYNLKKAGNQAIQPFISKHVSAAMMARISECGSWLQMAATRDLQIKKVHRANFCKTRFCPMCSWRKSKKEAAQIRTMMQYIKEKHDKAFIMLTLTAPNVRADKLRDEITSFNEAFKRFTKRKEIIPIIKGYVRKLEITYGKDEFITDELYQKKKAYFERRGLGVGDRNPSYDTYHPHFHCVLAVNKNYIKNPLNRNEWLRIWQECKRDETITQVDIRAIGKTPEKLAKDIQQISTYSAKTPDLSYSEEVFDVLYETLRGRQLLTFNGLFKEAAKLYKNKELDYLKEADENPYELLILYSWGYGSYIETERRELTEDERRDLRHEIEEEDAADE